ncbi:hypothetical protein Q3H58_004584 [Pseudomonas psychrotolerans]|nr:hypothetical protein [Pseudomonas psychrotolerans]
MRQQLGIDAGALAGQHQGVGVAEAFHQHLGIAFGIVVEGHLVPGALEQGIAVQGFDDVLVVVGDDDVHGGLHCCSEPPVEHLRGRPTSMKRSGGQGCAVVHPTRSLENRAAFSGAWLVGNHQRRTRQRILDHRAFEPVQRLDQFGGDDLRWRALGEDATGA